MHYSDKNQKKIGILRFGFVDIRRENRESDNLEHISCLVQINDKTIDILRAGDDLSYLHFQEEDSLVIDFKSKKIIDFNMLKIQVNKTLFSNFGNDFLKWFPLVIIQSNNQKIDSGIRALLEFHIEWVDNNQPQPSYSLNKLPSEPPSFKNRDPQNEGIAALKREIDEMRSKVLITEQFIERKPNLKHKVTILKNECESLYKSIAGKEEQEINKFLINEFIARKNILNNILSKVENDGQEVPKPTLKKRDTDDEHKPLEENLLNYLPQPVSSTNASYNDVKELNSSKTEQTTNHLEKTPGKTVKKEKSSKELSPDSGKKNGAKNGKVKVKSHKKESSSEKENKGDDIKRVFRDLDQEIGKLAQYSKRVEDENHVITSYNNLLEQYRQNLNVLEKEKEELKINLIKTMEENFQLIKLNGKLIQTIQRNDLPDEELDSYLQISDLCGFIKRTTEKIKKSKDEMTDERISKSINEALSKLLQKFMESEQRAKKFDEISQLFIRAAAEKEARGNNHNNQAASPKKDRKRNYSEIGNQQSCTKLCESSHEFNNGVGKVLNTHHMNCCLKNWTRSPKHLKTGSNTSFSAEESTFDQSGSDIDSALDTFRKTNFLDKDIIKQTDGSYRYGGKKINVHVINGVLSVRVGGGYMQLSEYLKLLKYQEQGISGENHFRNTSALEMSNEFAGDRRRTNLDDVETLRKNDQGAYLTFGEHERGKKGYVDSK